MVNNQVSTVALADKDGLLNDTADIAIPAILSTSETMFEASRRKQIIEKKYKRNFELVWDNYYTGLVKGNPDFIEYFRNVLFHVTEKQVELLDSEVLELANNQSGYPAIFTYVRQHSYLNFLTDLQDKGNAPREDRFTDGLILIEYSYCDMFLSNDMPLINVHAKHINPTIELKKVDRFI